MKLKIFKSLILFLLLLIFTAIFITTYGYLFEEAGLAAKKRLLNYPIFTILITPLFFWLSAFLCRKYSPNAAGHHLQSAINELKKYPDNFEKASPFLNLRLVVVKTISSLISSFGGGSLGKEGPSVHMSAGVFAIFANHYKRFLPKINLESWVLAGSAVGLTIVFNAPIAGIVFAIEKLSKMNLKLLKQNIPLVFISVAIITILFYKPDSMFKFREIDFSIKINWWPVILMVIFCGLLASFFKLICNFLYLKIHNIKSNLWHLIPIIFGLIAAWINLYSGIYSFGGGLFTIEQILSGNVILDSYKELWGRITNCILTFSSGSAGGLIAPAMAIGINIGSVTSSLFHDIDAGIFLLVGMAGFLSIILGEPIAAAVIIFETTGQNNKALPFLIAASLFSFAIWKLIEKIKAQFLQ